MVRLTELLNVSVAAAGSIHSLELSPYTGVGRVLFRVTLGAYQLGLHYVTDEDSFSLLHNSDPVLKRGICWGSLCCCLHDEM